MNQSCVQPTSPADIDLSLNTITALLSQAGIINIPLRRARKKRTLPWSPAIAESHHHHREALLAWIAEGRPTIPAATAVARKQTKKFLRSQCRREEAARREAFFNRIQDAWPRDSKTFYDLIQRQRSLGKSHPGSTLRIDGHLNSDPQNVLSEWTKHFTSLAQPLDSPHFNTDFLTSIKEDLADINMICHNSHGIPPPVTVVEVLYAIQRLNTGKAADEHGLTAEHLKNCAQVISPSLAQLYTSIFNLKHIPPPLKGGYTIAVHKKGKDEYCTDSYRGITITPILGKVFEHILVQRLDQTSTQSDLQFGFTRGRSPAMAALLTTEAITLSLDRKRPVFVAALDVKKAFDVVSHPILEKRLFSQCQDPLLWPILALVIEGNFTKIRVNGNYSDSITLAQGVGQGRITSTVNYKSYIDPLLRLLSDAGIGVSAGPLFIGAPTYVDDLMLIANSPEELQEMLSLTYNFSACNRYIIHPSKSQIITFGNKDDISCSIGPDPVPVTDSMTHLGLLRKSDELVPSSLIENRISLANRTAYSLMGAGLHGTNGLPPALCLRVYHTYVLPRMLYGLEALPLKPAHIQILEKTHRKFLRCFQSLPPNVAIPSIYLLLGKLTLEARLHIMTLVFLQSFISDSRSVLYKLAHRTSSIRDRNSHSWFRYVDMILEKYDLPSLSTLLTTRPAHSAWKNYVHERISSYCWSELQESARQKSSLTAIDWSSCSVGAVHHVWKDLKTPMDIKRASTKAKLMCDVYLLQSHRHRFNQYKVDATCTLCHSGIENREHFLLRCSALHAARSKLLPVLYHLYPDLTTCTLLNSSLVPAEIGIIFEKESQKLLHCLHETRTKLLLTL